MDFGDDVADGYIDKETGGQSEDGSGGDVDSFANEEKYDSRGDRGKGSQKINDENFLFFDAVFEHDGEVADFLRDLVRGDSEDCHYAGGGRDEEGRRDSYAVNCVMDNVADDKQRDNWRGGSVGVVVFVMMKPVDRLL